MAHQIYINGSTSKDDSNCIDYLSAITVQKKIDSIEDNEDVVVNIHTIGGEWDDGILIYDLLSFMRNHTTGLCHGGVYSVGTVILQACKKRLMMPNASFMVHWGHESYSGDHKTNSSVLAYYRTLQDKMLDIYSSRCVKGKFFQDDGYTKQEVKDFLTQTLNEKGDWYMGAKDAVYYGFADKVLTKREYQNVIKNIKTRDGSD